jgi:hypothetical protein
MSMLEAPKYNNSLRSFSIFIQTVWIVGLFSIAAGGFWLFNATQSYDLVGVSWSFALIYFGSGLISFGVIGMFLRQTARVIVDGLGGSVRIER